MKIYALLSNPNYPEDYIERIKNLGEFFIVNANKLTSKEIIDKYSDVEILMAGPSGIKEIDRELLDGLKNLKLIATLSVGTNWIDVKYANEKGILVSIPKGCNAESVAEHIWGMILGLSKRISEFDRGVREKGSYKFSDYKGLEMYGKTIGIVGLGEIGKRVARIANAFDMKIIGLNKSGDEVENVEMVTKDYLIRESDVIAVCVPLDDTTENMLTISEFEKMKKSVILINCAREKIVNKIDVVRAVQSETIFAYGVDTELMVPIANDDPYLSHPRILVNVHNAFNTYEAEVREDTLVYENIKAFVEGNPINLVK